MAKGRGWRSFLDLNGQSGRLRFLTLLVLLVGLKTLTEMANSGQWADARFLMPVLGILLVLSVIALVQRLHDRGHSGYWALLAAVPGVNLGLCLYALAAPARPLAASGRGSHPLAQGAMGLGLLLLFSLSLARVFYAPFHLPTGSNEPALLTGDMLIAALQPRMIQRGDLILFHHPITGAPHVKRVVGLPGEKVRMQGGLLVVDGQPATQDPAPDWHEVMQPSGPLGQRPRCSNAPVGEGGDCIVHQAIETLPGGRRHAVLDIEDHGPLDDTPEMTVPADSYFVMGDNRDNSLDSRIVPEAGGVGFVPQAKVIGVARFVLFSAQGPWWDILAWRSDRFFRGIE